jgi:hypothetical protein
MCIKAERCGSSALPFFMSRSGQEPIAQSNSTNCRKLKKFLNLQ